MAEDGESMLEIARTLGVAPGTLRKHYAEELREGHEVHAAKQPRPEDLDAMRAEWQGTTAIIANEDEDTRRAIAAVLGRVPNPPFGKRAADFSCQTPGCKVRVSRVTDPGVVFVKARGMWFCSIDCADHYENVRLGA